MQHLARRTQDPERPAPKHPPRTLKSALVVLFATVIATLAAAFLASELGSRESGPGSPQRTAAASSPVPSDSLEWAHTVVLETARSLGVPPEAVEVDSRAAGETAHAEGERVVVSAGLALRPELLRFVLAHEFAHQRLGHTRGSVLHEPSRQAQVQQEFDADALAVGWVCGAGGCDVEPFARMLEQTPEGPRHPPGVERAARVRQAARAFSTEAAALPSGVIFAREPAPDSFAMQARALSRSLPRVFGSD